MRSVPGPPRARSLPGALATEPRRDLQHVIVWASSPKGVRVFGATVDVEGKESRVREEYLVVDAKVQPTQEANSRWKAFLKCALVSCRSAFAGCIYGNDALCACSTYGAGVL
jgi:hypothetical protein